MRLLDDPVLRAQMGSAGQARAEEFSWPRVTAKVEEYYGFVIRRLAASGSLPPGFRAEIPQAPPPLRARASASCRPSGATSQRLGPGQPPGPGGVGHHQAGHRDRDRQDDEHRGQQRGRVLRSTVLTGNWNAYR